MMSPQKPAPIQTFHIVGQTSQTGQDGERIVYTIGKGVARCYCAIRETIVDGRPVREARADLTLQEAVAAIRAFKALDRGEHGI